jgi:hypothetical protein
MEIQKVPMIEIQKEPNFISPARGEVEEGAKESQTSAGSAVWRRRRKGRSP